MKKEKKRKRRSAASDESNSEESEAEAKAVRKDKKKKRSRKETKSSDSEEYGINGNKLNSILIHFLYPFALLRLAMKQQDVATAVRTRFRRMTMTRSERRARFIHWSQ